MFGVSYKVQTRLFLVIWPSPKVYSNRFANFRKGFLNFPSFSIRMSLFLLENIFGTSLISSPGSRYSSFAFKKFTNSKIKKGLIFFLVGIYNDLSDYKIEYKSFCLFKYKLWDCQNLEHS